ncbi:MAG: hypothetical protein AB7O56_03930 [Bauldia sp.]
MLRKLLTAGVAAAAIAAVATPVLAQEIILGAPQDMFINVTTGTGGEPVVDVTEVVLALGGYYRFNLVCPDAQNDDTGFHFEMPELLANAHLRVISIGDIEVYMQGMSFRAIECDEAGAARFSFHPMRRGVYEIYIRDHLDPPQEAFVQVVVE